MSVPNMGWDIRKQICAKKVELKNGGHYKLKLYMARAQKA
jgi:hypothetical protein